MHTAYKFRLYPTSEQVQFLRQNFGCTRKLWNEMVNDYRTSGTYEFPTYYKKKHVYMKDVDSLSLTNVWMYFKKAVTNHRNNPKHFGEPTFKAKNHSIHSYTTNNQKGTVRIVDGKWLKVPKLKSLIRVKCHRQVTEAIRSVTLSETSTGKFYVSIICEYEQPSVQPTHRSVGVDLGISHLAITSDGEKIDNPRHSSKLREKLRREQRKMSRQQLQAKRDGRKLSECKNYQKQKRKVALLHEKIRNRRNDHLHKVSTHLVKNHDLVVLETLKVKNMLKNRKLSRAIADCGWGMFVDMVTYKCERYGRQLIQIDKWFPSSQLCSSCGHRDGVKPLHVREWKCVNCDTVHDRDINASINILLEGQRMLLKTM